MKRLLTFAVALAVPALALPAATTWNIDPAHSTSSFAVKHLVVSTVRGQFGKTTGVIKMDDKDPTKGSVEATVDVNTIDTRVTDRDNHLKSPDFFDAANNPTITFKSTKVQKAGADKLKVTGDLTMKGTTKPVTFTVTYTKPITGMKGEKRRAFSGTTTINRKDFGLNWSKMVEAGPVVSDKVDLQVDIEAIEEAPQNQTQQAAAANKEEKQPASTSDQGSQKK